MASKSTVLKRVQELGCTFEDLDHDESPCMAVLAPTGKVFAVTGSNTLVEYYGNVTGQRWKPRAYQNLLDDMMGGLEDESVD
jgi:hypothetical protein